ncbi:MAG TPA: hypothetical protein VN639_05915 [Azonexus sp.]|nr:hypothetical protein [Azonexus sp.]
MTAGATVGFFKNEFVATLSDGRHIEQSDLHAMAALLANAGVQAGNVKFEWHPGQRMITAGQQVALCAELRRLKQDPGSIAKAA